MKLIIDIDETDYNFIKSVRSIMKNSDTFQRISIDLFMAVKDGEVVYPMWVAPVSNDSSSGDIRWEVKTNENNN